MSSTRIHRSAAALVVVTMGLVVGGSSVASAHRGVYDSDTCEESLTRVWDWPGDFETDSGRYVIFSDAYESYILRQPPCDRTRPLPPRWDPGQVGHSHPTGPAPSDPEAR